VYHYSVQTSSYDAETPISRPEHKVGAETKERCMCSILQKHPARILDVLLDLDQELHCLSAVKKTMIIGESQVHHGSDDNLSIDNNCLVVDGMQSKNCSLRKVDDWGSHQRAEDSSITDGEGSTSHILDCELVVTSLERN
jgi:hypothetical protein